MTLVLTTSSCQKPSPCSALATIYSREEMPSIEESKRFVEETLEVDADHDAILNSLQAEIDKHNRIRDETEQDVKQHKKRRHHDRSPDRQPDLRFRFKKSVEKPRRRRREKRHDDERPRDEDVQTEAEKHPLPREEASSTTSTPNNAFLSSLLDALADDEAAEYWEHVYNQPIHIYERPTVRTETGELEQMSDEQYAAWVKTKMWEKSHPEIKLERDRMQRKRQEEQELKERRKKEFLRQRAKEAKARTANAQDDSDEYDYVFDFSSVPTEKEHDPDRSLWIDAWKRYGEGWTTVKASIAGGAFDDAAKHLPWPVMKGQKPDKANIRDFLDKKPLVDGETKQQVLKAERVRWHPDKIQQLFRGSIDEKTMRVVTEISQIINSLLTESV